MIQTTSKTVTLSPGQVLPMAISASVFSCADATAQFHVSFDGGEYIPMQAGWTMDARPNRFNMVTLQNQSLVALTISFYAGNSALLYSPVQTSALVTAAPTYAKGSDAQNINSGAIVAFSGLDGTCKRKQIIVTNFDAAAALYLRDANNKAFLPIFAGESKTVELTGACSLYNPSGGAVNYCVGEIFYA